MKTDYRVKNKAKDIAIIKALLKSYNAEHLAEMAEVFLRTDRDKWIETTDRSVAVFNAKALWVDGLIQRYR